MNPLRRALVLLLLLASCEKVFGLTEIPDAPPPDGPPDGPPDAALHLLGCADQTREGFADVTAFPNVAACASAWTQPGLRGLVPTCDRMAGNDMPANLSGGTCSAIDSCEEGWHVCQSALDLAQHLPSTSDSCAQLQPSGDQMFFATGQSGNAGLCDATGTNDFFGCGNYGVAAGAECSPLDRSSTNECFDIKVVGGWSCVDSTAEVNVVTKSDARFGGGVLCCRDELL